MKFKLFKADGTSSGERDVPHFPSLEEGRGVDALRQVIIAVRANLRQGNASTKLRSEVSGSGKKIHRQKGLGIGRAGDKRASARTAFIFFDSTPITFKDGDPVRRRDDEERPRVIVAAVRRHEPAAGRGFIGRVSQAARDGQEAAHVRRDR